MHLLKCILLFSVALGSSFSLNILAFMPQVPGSHFKAFEELFKTLIVKGNNVTIISYLPVKSLWNNYTAVIITPGKEVLKGISNEVVFSDTIFPRIVLYKEIQKLIRFSDSTFKDLASDEQIQKFVSENHNFDVVLAEIFNNECHVDLLKAMKYRGPVIGEKYVIPIEMDAIVNHLKITIFILLVVRFLIL